MSAPRPSPERATPVVPGATTGATSEINTAASCLNRPRLKGGRQVAHFKLPESQIPPGGMIVKVAIPGRTARRPSLTECPNNRWHGQGSPPSGPGCLGASKVRNLDKKLWVHGTVRHWRSTIPWVTAAQRPHRPGVKSLRHCRQYSGVPASEEVNALAKLTQSLASELRASHPLVPAGRSGTREGHAEPSALAGLGFSLPRGAGAWPSK